MDAHPAALVAAATVIPYLFGVLTGTVLFPFGMAAFLAVASFPHGRWMELDHGKHGSCGVPNDQWSPIYRCPRCGARQVRAWLYRAAGRPLLERWVGRGPRDEAWLNGETA